jgi:hypothetical protein
MRHAAIFKCSAFSPPTGERAAEHRRPTRAVGAGGRRRCLNAQPVPAGRHGYTVHPGRQRRRRRRSRRARQAWTDRDLTARCHQPARPAVRLTNPSLTYILCPRAPSNGAAGEIFQSAKRTLPARLKRAPAMFLLIHSGRAFYAIFARFSLIGIYAAFDSAFGRAGNTTCRKLGRQARNGCSVKVDIELCRLDLELELRGI